MFIKTSRLHAYIILNDVRETSVGTHSCSGEYTTTGPLSWSGELHNAYWVQIKGN